jgi:hypothetical protein
MYRKVMFVLLAMMPLAVSAQDAGQRAARFNEVLEKRFAVADSNGDGQLTRDEAAAGMPKVYHNFDAIDRERKGVISLDQIRRVVVERAANRRRGGVGMGDSR